MPIDATYTLTGGMQFVAASAAAGASREKRNYAGTAGIAELTCSFTGWFGWRLLIVPVYAVR